MKLFVLIAALAISYANAQNVKSVRGNYATKGFHHNQNMINLFGNHTQIANQNGSLINQRDIGVCYIEVPTASLIKDSSNVPAGNGSRPDLSRIRTCCHGYIRNIHNYWICDPVCSEECVNALCTAPEVCTCFPEHVKNEAGYCVATCPIGCQNGHCSGGECMCREGYKLHRDGLYCVPICKDDCGGVGNCTAPQTCTCKPGYEASTEGTCKAHCSACANGDCIGPNECRCRAGYYLDEKGDCKARCERGCSLNGICTAPNLCSYPGGLIAPSGQEPLTTTTSNYHNYSYPSYTPPNHQPQPGQSNPSKPNNAPNPVYFTPSDSNKGPVYSDNQIRNPINQTAPNPSNHLDYPQSSYYGNPNQNYPSQINSNREPGHPDTLPIFNTPLAPYPSAPTASDTRNQTSTNNQPGYPYVQNQSPPGYFFNPYGGYYMPTYPNYGSSNVGPTNPNDFKSSNYPQYPNYPGYPQTNRHHDHNGLPNKPGVNPQHNTSGSNSSHDDSSNPGSGYQMNPYQPGYPYPGGNFPEQNAYYQGYPHQPGHNQPGYNQFSQPGQPGYLEQPGQPRQPGQPNQPGISDQSGQLRPPGRPGTPSKQIVYNQFGQPIQPGQAQYIQFGQLSPSGQPGQYSQPGQPQYISFVKPNQPDANQPDFNQRPTQIETQVEYLNLPKYINMTDYLKQATSSIPAYCMTPCLNAGCAHGNRCVCYEGFVALTDGTSCKPVCRGCFNGVCTAPNVCICKEGYFRDPSIKGRSGCVKRQRRSVTLDEIMPVDVGKLLVFEIPEEY